MTKPVRTPASVQKVTTASTSLYQNRTFFRQIVGALQYTTLTRPADLFFAVNKVCQSMHNPTEENWAAVKRIIRYLQHTAGYGPSILKSDDLFSLQAFCDSDMAGNSSYRKSTAGFAIYMGKNIISWASRKQRTVARSP